MREATSGITQRKLAEKHTGTVLRASSFRGLTRRASHKSSIANCRSSRRPRESPLPRVATSQTFVVAPIVVQSEEAQSSSWGCWPIPALAHVLPAVGKKGPDGASHSLASIPSQPRRYCLRLSSRGPFFRRCIRLACPNWRDQSLAGQVIGTTLEPIASPQLQIRNQQADTSQAAHAFARHVKTRLVCIMLATSIGYNSPISSYRWPHWL